MPSHAPAFRRQDIRQAPVSGDGAFPAQQLRLKIAGGQPVAMLNPPQHFEAVDTCGKVFFSHPRQYGPSVEGILGLRDRLVQVPGAVAVPPHVKLRSGIEFHRIFPVARLRFGKLHDRPWSWARESFKQEALASWVAYKETGRHLTGHEVHVWLSTWGTDAETAAPECHK